LFHQTATRPPVSSDTEKKRKGKERKGKERKEKKLLKKISIFSILWLRAPGLHKLPFLASLLDCVIH
jgi:hypothetical protein